MKMKNVFPGLLLLCLALTQIGCGSLKQLQVKSLHEVKLSGWKEKKPVLNFDLNMYNPSPVGFKVMRMDLTLQINHTNITTLSTTSVVRMKRKSEVAVPMVITPEWKDLSQIMKSGIKVFLAQKFSMGLSGEITVKKFIFKRKIPFDISTDQIAF